MGKVRHSLSDEKHPVCIGNIAIQPLPEADYEFMFNDKAGRSLPPSKQGVDDDDDHIDAEYGDQCWVNTMVEKKEDTSSASRPMEPCWTSKPTNWRRGTSMNKLIPSVRLRQIINPRQVRPSSP